jgi:DNA replication protein DnaC
MKSKPETVRAVCQGCGNKFDRIVLRVLGKEVFRQRECSDCYGRREKEARAAGNVERQKANEEGWLFCPPRYRNCDRALLPIAVETIDRVLEWRPRVHGRGLGLVGLPHTGKRRLLYLLAKDLHFSGVHVAQISDFEFVRVGSEDEELRAFTRHTITKIKSAPVLIFSDISAQRLTERAQEEFYSLIEHRALRALPILWSTQFAREQIAARFVNRTTPELALKLGRAAVDRLTQVSDVIQVERESVRSAEMSAQARSA